MRRVYIEKYKYWDTIETASSYQTFNEACLNTLFDLQTRTAYPIRIDYLIKGELEESWNRKELLALSKDTEIDFNHGKLAYSYFNLNY